MGETLKRALDPRCRLDRIVELAVRAAPGAGQEDRRLRQRCGQATAPESLYERLRLLVQRMVYGYPPDTGSGSQVKILILHSRYLSGWASGENSVVRDEERLLTECGHDVVTWTPEPGPELSHARLGSRPSGRRPRSGTSDATA